MHEDRHAPRIENGAGIGELAQTVGAVGEEVFGPIVFVALARAAVVPDAEVVGVTWSTSGRKGCRSGSS